jgi:assimilatory nitrate reductase catalytic subunit
LVVQDLYHTTATAERADLVLPAAGWGEKEGNSSILNDASGW